MNLPPPASKLQKNNQKILSIKPLFILILFLSLILLLSTVVFAIPNSLTLQGKLTNTAGSAQVGTFNFTFRIYDAATNGNILYELANYNITTDANGIYDVILGNVNLSFADQYYLGITVGTDGESSPRINLTSAPYSFRANTSEALNPNASYVVTNLSITGSATIGTGGTTLEISTQTFNLTKTGNINLANNLSLGDKITFRFGQLIDNLVSGFLRVTGNLNVTGNITTTQDTLFVDSTSGKVGIGTTSLDTKLKISGDVNATGTVWALGVNLSTLSTSAAGWTDDGSVVRLSTVSDIVGIGTPTPLSTLHVNGTGASGGFRVTNDSGYTAFFVNSTSGNVGIGTANPTKLLTVQGPSSGQTQIAVNSIDANNRVQIALNNDASSFGAIDVYGSTQAGTLLSSLQLSNSTFFKGSSNDANAVVALGSITNNPLVFGTNNAERMRITAGGNVGIGTSSPYNTLTVVGSVGISGSLNASSINTTGSAYFATSGVGNVGINTTAPAQTLTVQGTLNVTSQPTRSGDLFVASSGNVGIGTTSPSEKLTVIGNVNISGYLNISGDLVVNKKFNVSAASGDVSVQGTIFATNISTTNLSAINFPLGWTNITNYPAPCPDGQFVTSVNDTLTCVTPTPASGGGWTDDGSVVRLTTATDLVGIGTTTPNATLDVRGTGIFSTGFVNFTNNTAFNQTLYVVNGLVGIGTAIPEAKLDISGGGILLDNAQYIGWENTAGTDNIATINLDAGNNFRFQTTGNEMYFDTNGVTGYHFRTGATTLERFTILDSGYIGVNTSSPSGTFHVKNANTDFIVTSGGKVGINTTTPAQTLTVQGTLNVTTQPTRSGDLFVASSGNVGIGTTSPYNTLTVVGSVGVSGSLNASSINTTGSAYFATSSGSVGIGTASPNQKLVVAGGVNITGGLNVSGGPIRAIASNSEYIELLNDGAGNSYLRTPSSGGSNMIFAVEGNSVMYFRTNGAYRALLNQNAVLKLTATGQFAFAPGTDVDVAADTAITRNNSGVLEINSGTPGALRDLQLRAINPNSTNLGIGTTSSNYLLQVASGTDGRSVNLSNVLYVNGSSGNVGIGTTSLDTKLKVAGDLNTTGTVWALGVNLSTLSTTAAGWTDDGSVVRLTTATDLVGIGTTTPNATLDVRGTGIFSTGFVNFTNNTAFNQTLYVVNGNVGIGTTTPGSKLTVAGTFNASGSSTGPGLYVDSSGNVGIGTTTPTVRLNVIGSDLVDSGVVASLWGFASGRASTIQYTDGFTYNFGAGTDTNGDFGFWSGRTVALAGVERMVIQQGGNVGIGTSSPYNTLTVVGSVGVSGSLNASSINTTGNAYFATSSGNVGIGTASPTDKLHVAGAARIAVNDTNNISTTNILTLDHFTQTPLNSTGGIGVGILLRAIDNGSNVDDVALINATLVNALNGSEASSIGFYTRTSGGPLTPRLFINGSNVGIGTTGPSSRLDIQDGAIQFAEMTAPGTPATNNLRLYVIDSSNTQALEWKDHNGETIRIQPYDGLIDTSRNAVSLISEEFRIYNSGSPGVANFERATQKWASNIFQILAEAGGTGVNRSLQLFSGTTTGLLINNAGQIGINTTTPAQTLTVQGTFNATASGGSGDLFLTSSGNVGINTTSPNQALTVVGNINVTGDVNITNNLDVRGSSITLGDATTDTLQVIAQIASDLIPNNNDRDLGSPSNFWRRGYIDILTVNNLSVGQTNISGTTSPSFTINSNYTGDDDLEVALIFERGTPTINAVLKWDPTNKRFDMNFPLNIQSENNLTVDTNTLFVDGSVNRVGIGTTSPTQTLTVVGTLNVSRSTSGGDLFVDSSGNVGIGTTSPYNTLTVVGSVGVSGSLNASSINTTGNAYFATSGVGNVGIGTTIPDNKLTIAGTDTDANLATPGVLHLNITDSHNKTVTNFITLDHNLNNPANSTGGIGLGILFRAINNDSELVNVSFINATLVNAINGSEASALTFYTLNGSGGSQGRLIPRLVLNGTDTFVSVSGGNTYLNPNGGNVGIGTTGPATALDVNGVITTAGISGHYLTGTLNANSQLVTNVQNLYGWSSGLTIYGSQSAATNLTLDSTNQATKGNIILAPSGGNVGIGTTTPYNTLTVVGSVGVSGSINASSINTTGSAYFATSGVGNVGINTTTPAQTLTVQGTLNVSNPGRSGDLFVASSGNVGIGTTNPGMKLVVEGNVNISQNLTVNNSLLFVDGTSGNVGIGTTAPGTKLDVVGGTSSFRIAGTGDGTTIAFFRTSDVANSLVINSATNAALGASTVLDVGSTSAGSSAVFRGRIGIGTVPTSNALTVNGSLNITGNISIGNSIYLAENQSLYQPVYGSDDELVLYLPFNAPNGSVQYDRSPFGNDGLLQGGINCNATLGKYGSGCLFNNNTNDYIDLGTKSASNWFTNTSDFSIEVWLNLRDSSGTLKYILVDKTNEFFRFGISTETSINLWQFPTSVSVTTTRMTLNEWHHVVATFDSLNSTNGNAKIYIDGVLDGIADNQRTFPEVTNNWQIGGSGTAARFFNGSMDEVRVYKRALAPEEIRTHYLRGNSFGASGAITADKFRVVNTTGTKIFEINQTGAMIAPGGVQRLTIDSNGNVGIGTTGPSNKLHITTTQADVNSATVRIGRDATTAPQSLMFGTGVTNNYAIGRLGSSDDLVFGQLSGTGAFTEHVRILATNGNVGINTTNPGALLHLNGTKPVLRITPSGTPGDTASIQFGSPAGESLNAINYDPGAGTFALKVNNFDAITVDSAGADSGQNITFGLNTAAAPRERMVILGTGQIGINVTSPTQTLHVAGTANITAKSSTSFLMTADGNVVFHLE